ncbi:hypothetical protein PoB_001404100 [Plakobranchus ocellatus]|uniref:Uncharacterized protein n=1 Tax=Plakobranchus ocellatus TaxID=259542 RepID=A0AAV3YYV8_9GAST|nr:hypothetical protein PoB_001404100 [Plakobranchus ocellatus]
MAAKNNTLMSPFTGGSRFDSVALHLKTAAPKLLRCSRAASRPQTEHKTPGPVINHFTQGSSSLSSLRRLSLGGELEELPARGICLIATVTGATL